jgi:hypothetical protein
MHRFLPLLAAMALVHPGPLRAQQVADTAFHYPIAHPAYATGAGPVVAIDEAHYNFHTASGRYLPFARLLERDGYVVRPWTGRFTAEGLRAVRVLVIANALAERNRLREPDSLTDWSLPTPSAFTAEEIAAVHAWVAGGGSLLLIADHMPFGGNAADLAAAFGVRFSNGFADDTSQKGPRGLVVFRRGNGSLPASTIAAGRSPAERVDSVATFTGQAFQAEPAAHAEDLLVFGPAATMLTPDTAWVFHESTPRRSVAGWLQGGALRVGKGRVAMFGEAAMFSAQLGGPQRRPMGMNAPVAAENAQFLLNVLHWLTGVLRD